MSIKTIRALIKEMAFGGLVGPVIGKPIQSRYRTKSAEKEIRGLNQYYKSGLFTKRAMSYFRDEHWPYPVYLIPYLGAVPKDPQIPSHIRDPDYVPEHGLYWHALTGGRRLMVENHAAGLEIAQDLGVDTKSITESDSLVILFNSTKTDKNTFGSLWMVIHSIFDSDPEEIQVLSPTYADLLRNNPLVLSDDDYDMPRLGLTLTTPSWNQLASADDALAEAMTQETIQRHMGGFRFDDTVKASYDAYEQQPITDEERAILEGLKKSLVKAADEFINNCRGKFLFVLVTP